MILACWIKLFSGCEKEKQEKPTCSLVKLSVASYVTVITHIKMIILDFSYVAEDKVCKTK